MGKKVRTLTIKTADGGIDTWEPDEYTNAEFTETNVLLVMKNDKIAAVYNPMYWLTVEFGDR